MAGIENINNIKAGLNQILNQMHQIHNHHPVFSKLESQSVNQLQKEKSPFENTMLAANKIFEQVNTLQNTTESIKNAYLLGDNHVSFSDVVVASQKSKLAFEGLVTVRNKILEAYKEIMNMPI